MSGILNAFFGGNYGAKPGAPTIGTATATGSTTATVTYTAPASNGGVPITLYTATSSPGGITGTLATSGSGTITVSGLTSGVSYTFTVTATNAIGTGPASAASNSITTNSAPVNTVAPVVSGTAQNGQTLSTTNGTWTGTPASFSYAYQWQRSGSNIGSATASTYTLTVSDVGFTIRCVVTATNTAGSTAANSNSTSAVIAAVPSAPTIGTATLSGTTASVTYTASASNGGATITSYTAVSSPGGITGSLATSGSGTITVSGLSGGSTYTFTVYATNSSGNSPSSAASNSVTVPANFLATINYGYQVNPQTVGVDSSSNMYTADFASGLASRITKINSLGSLQWAKYEVAGSIFFNNVYNCSATDSSGNTYNTGFGGDYSLLKYNTSGTAVFAYTQGAGFYAITTDSSGNTIQVGGARIVKSDSSGNIIWQKTIGGFLSMPAVATDSSNNIYVLGNDFFSVSSTSQIAKFDSSGTVVYASSLSTPFNAQHIAVDSTGSVYFNAGAYPGNTGSNNIIKLDSSGAFAWARNFSDGDSNLYFTGFAVDSSDNVYGIGIKQYPNSLFFVKYNSSGTIQWQREINAGASTTASISLGPDNNIYFNAKSNPVLTGRLPSDGSKTGTYSVGGTSFTYAASSFTNSNVTYTINSATISSSSSSLSPTSYGVVSVNDSVTYSSTTI